MEPVKREGSKMKSRGSSKVNGGKQLQLYCSVNGEQT